MPLSTARKFLIDLFWIAKRVPVSVIAGRIHLASLIAARNNCVAPPPFTVMFAKALAQIAGNIPELRQNYVRYPVPHLYETFQSSVSILIEREIDGASSVMPVLLKSPDTAALDELAWQLSAAKNDPQTEVRHIQRLLDHPLAAALAAIALAGGLSFRTPAHQLLRLVCYLRAWLGWGDGHLSIIGRYDLPDLRSLWR